MDSTIRTGPGGDWMPIADALRTTVAELGVPRAEASKRLIAALKAGRIRNGGIMEEWSDKMAYRNIHLYTDDLMTWLGQEKLSVLRR